MKMLFLSLTLLITFVSKAQIGIGELKIGVTTQEFKDRFPKTIWQFSSYGQAFHRYYNEIAEVTYNDTITSHELQFYKKNYDRSKFHFEFYYNKYNGFKQINTDGKITSYEIRYLKLTDNTILENVILNFYDDKLYYIQFLNTEFIEGLLNHKYKTPIHNKDMSPHNGLKSNRITYVNDKYYSDSSTTKGDGAAEWVVNNNIRILRSSDLHIIRIIDNAVNTNLTNNSLNYVEKCLKQLKEATLNEMNKL